MTFEQPAPSGDGQPRRPRRQMPKCFRPHCGGNLVMNRNGDYVTITCIACGRSVHGPIPAHEPNIRSRVATSRS